MDSSLISLHTNEVIVCLVDRSQYTIMLRNVFIKTDTLLMYEKKKTPQVQYENGKNI